MLQTFKDTWHLFGTTVEFVHLAVFVLVLFLLNMLIRKRRVRMIVAFLSALLVVAQLTALYFTQEFIGYQFYVHLSLRGADNLIPLYHRELLIAISLLFLGTGIFYGSRILFNFFRKKAVSLLKTTQKRTATWMTAAAVVGILVGTMILFQPGGVGRAAFRLYHLMDNDTEDFSTALRRVGIDRYTLPENLHARPGKNLIVLSLESLERAYLGDSLGSLTPGLRHLRETWTYLPLEQNDGSGWTSGALYTLLTGFPAYFGMDGNDIFQEVYHNSVASIGETLSRAGYDLNFLIENANFSGTKEMLHTLGVGRVIDRYNIGGARAADGQYSARDYDLFRAARRIVEEAQTEARPFGLFVSTVDTHAPNGIRDDRMLPFVPDREDDLAFMVSAVDYMVADFIAFLDSTGVLHNTAVFILPDHLKMGSPLRFEGTGPRGLYVLTNVPATRLGPAADTSRTLYQIDLPPLLLSGAEVEHNQRFLTEFVAEDRQEFIVRHQAELMKVNLAGLLRSEPESYEPQPITNTGIDTYLRDTLRFIAHAGGAVDDTRYTNSLEALNRSYGIGYRLFELDLLETSDGRLVAAHDWPNWAEQTDYTGPVPPSHADFMAHRPYGRYTPLDMAAINRWFTRHPETLLVTDKVRSPARVAAVFDHPERLWTEVFDREGLAEARAIGAEVAMPNFDLVERIGADKVIAMGIKRVAAARSQVLEHPEIARLLRQAGIHIYLYGLDQLYGIDERYVLRFELDRAYGMYVDYNVFELEETE